jgi:hypothetical protein
MSSPVTGNTEAVSSSSPLRRDSLNGSWILDKNRGDWSMTGYLETMNVDPLAIEAHEKGEKETDTIHTIEIDPERNRITLVKRSRVNNDLLIELDLDQEHVEYLPPGNRPKRMLAHSENPGHLCIQSSLLTVNGKATVCDTKRIIQEEDKTVLRQELIIRNEQNGKTHTTIRHYDPYLETPPHLLIHTSTTEITASSATNSSEGEAMLT